MSHPTLHHLRIFVQVATHRSFSRTSMVMGIAQPTISRVIAELENCWSGKLFLRTGRGVELSDIGQKALVRVQSILRDIDDLSEDMRSERASPAGIVTVAIIPSLVGIVMPDLARELRDHRPGIRLKVVEGFSDQVIRNTSDGTADIGLYAQYFERSSEGAPQASTSSIVLVAPRASDFAETEIDFVRLADFRLVLPMLPNALRHCIDVHARKNDLRLDVVAEAVSFTAQLEIAAYCGYGFLAEPSSQTLRKIGPEFQVASIRNPSFHRKIVLSTGHGKPLTRATLDVVSRLTNRMNALRLDFEQV